jgi:hypothetical protein
MKNYSNAADTISDLHRKGFVNDFQLSGNDLLWIQERFFIRAGEFTILEYHTIPAAGNNSQDELVVFGIVAPYHNIKGILLKHYKSYTNNTPPILVKKLNELNMQAAAI